MSNIEILMIKLILSPENKDSEHSAQVRIYQGLSAN